MVLLLGWVVAMLPAVCALHRAHDALAFTNNALKLRAVQHQRADLVALPVVETGNLAELAMSASQAYGIDVDISDMPGWAQKDLAKAGFDYFSGGEMNEYLFFQQAFAVTLGAWITRQRGGKDDDSKFGDDLRRERRRRSGLDDEPTSVDDVASNGAWFTFDDDDDEQDDL